MELHVDLRQHARNLTRGHSRIADQFSSLHVEATRLAADDGSPVRSVLTTSALDGAQFEVTFIDITIRFRGTVHLEVSPARRFYGKLHLERRDGKGEWAEFAVYPFNEDGEIQGIKARDGMPATIAGQGLEIVLGAFELALRQG